MRWPSRKPTLEDVYRVAGLMEGDGSFSGTVSVAQRDREVLDKAQQLFGGRVGGPYLVRPSLRKTQMYVWYAGSSRGRGIARSVYHLVSSRRQAQIRAFLGVSRESRLPDRLTHEHPRYLTDWGADDSE